MAHSKKAQTEIIGLLVIVMLLIIIGVVYLGFLGFKEQSALPTIRSNIQADHTLNALMKVSLPLYSDKTVEELVVACSLDPDDCATLQTALEEVLLVVLDPRETYSFSILEEEAVIHSFGGCQVGVVARYSFIEDAIYYETALKLCPR